MGGIGAILQETFSGIKVIKAFGLEGRSIERFARKIWISWAVQEVHQV
jgi:ABC-type multidrug transport system fused ATPase/permease subunit